jgi:hypothetical protein
MDAILARLVLRDGLELDPELVEPAKLVQEVQCGGVNRVAPKVAEEVPMLLEDQHVDPLAGQQQPRNDSRRTAADDATRRLVSPHDCVPLGPAPHALRRMM